MTIAQGEGEPIGTMTIAQGEGEPIGRAQDR